MLVIRDGQFDAMAAIQRDELRAFLHGHVGRHFPAQVAALGPEGTDAFLERTVARARVFGASSGSAVCMFVDLAMAFGEDFDTNAARRWLVRTLDDPAVPDADERIALAARMAAEPPGST
jgi:hypothetical protein